MLRPSIFINECVKHRFLTGYLRRRGNEEKGVGNVSAVCLVTAKCDTHGKYDFDTYYFGVQDFIFRRGPKRCSKRTEWCSELSGGFCGTDILAYPAEYDCLDCSSSWGIYSIWICPGNGFESGFPRT